MQADNGEMFKIMRGLGEIAASVKALKEDTNRRLGAIDDKVDTHTEQLNELTTAAAALAAVQKFRDKSRARLFAWAGLSVGVIASASAAAGFIVRHTAG